MNYSIINGLFFAIPVSASFLLLSHYLSRRESRLSIAKGTDSSTPVLQNRGKKLAVHITVLIVYLVSALLVDNHWDSFRQTYDVPARIVDVALLSGLATIGLIATLLTAFIGLVELFDRLRSKQHD